ncbi:unnamed protein product [Owenia fusiformis]|uniref:Uncharacterized protein n=1 Tax=Owenia fusiformis TaxID=6347 RepID=A0A8J1UZ85_OWEFU|nr:unnamed protein product [Owenia fusiformis]
MAFNNTDTYPENTTDTLLDQRMRPNCSVGVNGTIHASCRTRSRPPVEDGQKAFLVILVILIVVANTAVLVAIYLSKNKTRMNFFIMQLAIADLLVGLFHVTSDLGQKYSIEWIGGDVTCKLVQFLKVLVSYASTFVLVSLSIDRLDAIARPLNFSRSGQRSKILIFLAWFISFVFSLPQFFLYKGYTYWSISVCGMTLTKTWQIKLYFILSAVAIFIVPAVIVTMCYIVIVYVVWSKSKALTPQTERSTKTSSKGWSIRKLQNGSSNGTASTKTSSSSSNRGVIPQAKIRTIKMTLVIVIAFIVCWAPYFVYNFLDVFGYTSNVKVSIFVQSLSSFNSAANPLIYGLFSSRICRNLRCQVICSTDTRRQVRETTRILSYPNNSCASRHVIGS